MTAKVEMQLFDVFGGDHRFPPFRLPFVIASDIAEPNCGSSATCPDRAAAKPLAAFSQTIQKDVTAGRQGGR
jgi:hypothetical protein